MGRWVVAGDALKRCLSGDVSYPHERALVNRRGRLGVASATLQPHSPNCRLARLSVLYLNTWRICSLGRCLLLLYVRDRERKKREGRRERTLHPALFLIFVSPSDLHLLPPLFRESPLVSLTNRRSFSLDCLSSVCSMVLQLARSRAYNRTRVMRRAIQINLNTRESVS